MKITQNLKKLFGDRSPAVRHRYVKIINNLLMIFMLSTLMLAMLALWFRMSGAEMKIYGMSMYRLVSGSMAPKYKTGDYVIVKETDASTLKVGDIIAYVSEAPDTAGEVIIHRIVDIQNDGTIVTRGDANPIDDKYTTSKSHVLGRVSSKLSILRYADSVFSNAMMFFLFVVLPVALMIFNEAMLLIRRENRIRHLKTVITECGLDPQDEELLALAECYGDDAVRKIAAESRVTSPEIGDDVG